MSLVKPPTNDSLAWANLFIFNSMKTKDLPRPIVSVESESVFDKPGVDGKIGFKIIRVLFSNKTVKEIIIENFGSHEKYSKFRKCYTLKDSWTYKEFIKAYIEIGWRINNVYVH